MQNQPKRVHIIVCLFLQRAAFVKMKFTEFLFKFVIDVQILRFKNSLNSR